MSKLMLRELLGDRARVQVVCWLFTYLEWRAGSRMEVAYQEWNGNRWVIL